VLAGNSKRSMDSVAKVAGGQAEMSEDLGDHGGVFDGGVDVQGAVAVGTLFRP